MSTNTADIGSNGKAIIGSNGKLQVGGCCCGACPTSIVVTFADIVANCKCSDYPSSGYIFDALSDVNGSYTLDATYVADNYVQFSGTIPITATTQDCGPHPIPIDSTYASYAINLNFVDGECKITRLEFWSEYNSVRFFRYSSAASSAASLGTVIHQSLSCGDNNTTGSDTGTAIVVAA